MPPKKQQKVEEETKQAEPATQRKASKSTERKKSVGKTSTKVQPKEEKKSTDKKTATPKKSASKAPKDLGPMPKNKPSAYQLYFSEKQEEFKAQLTQDQKQSDVMKLAGDAWKTVSEEVKKEFQTKAEEAAKLRENQLKEREKKGFFTFPDGTKSTDPANKNRVQKVKVEEEEESKKSKIQKKVEGEDDSDEEEQIVKPPRVKSSLSYFMSSQMKKFKEENPDVKHTAIMGLVQEKWKTLDEEAKAPYEKLAAADVLRKARQEEDFKKNKVFTMEDGTLSNTAENIKKFGAKKPAPKANKTVQSSSDEEEAPKRKSLKTAKKKITNNKEKEQTDHELNIESD